jgi:small subunit ribosomal protein S14
MGKAKTVADAARRQFVQSHEVLRRAYLLLARNETVPARVRSLVSPDSGLCICLYRIQVRHQASLALASRNVFPPQAIPSRVKNRCIESGRGRGVLGKDIKLCRVCVVFCDCFRMQTSLTSTAWIAQHKFKLAVEAGELHGWERAAW